MRSRRESCNTMKIRCKSCAKTGGLERWKQSSRLILVAKYAFSGGHYFNDKLMPNGSQKHSKTSQGALRGRSFAIFGGSEGGQTFTIFGEGNDHAKIKTKSQKRNRNGPPKVIKNDLKTSLGLDGVHCDTPWCKNQNQITKTEPKWNPQSQKGALFKGRDYIIKPNIKNTLTKNEH